LVSFRLCPFVRRSVIMMRLKGMDHDVVYIDLADPPGWFLALSPLKKVPLLRVGDDVLFESGAINEYLDEVGEGSLLPAEPVEKARHRAWIEFSTRAMWHAFHLTAETTDAGFDQALSRMWDDFDRLEGALSGTPYFAGGEPGLVDVSFAPLFQQLEHLADLNADIVDMARHPGVNAWSRSLCAHPVIREALGDDFVDLYHALIHRRQGVMSRFVDASRFRDQTPGRY
jgi:glutathione S-transferase